ncbi:hypothetical protein EDB85DRAFT_1976503, partial [Lactarius pseudohatsudake]
MGLGLELTSQDHSATWTFLHTRRLYQGPGLPLTRRGPTVGPNFPIPRTPTTFLFRLSLPPFFPSVNGLWKQVRSNTIRGPTRTGLSPASVLSTSSSDPGDDPVLEDDGLHTRPVPESLVIGEWQDFGAGPRPWRYAGHGKEQVKNHSAKK